MSLSVVFMGTPDFASTCLERLLSQDYNIVGVFSQPDRPKGRGNKLQPTPVKEIALAYNIPVYQPEKVRTPQVLTLLQQLAPDVIVVVAYGKILPKSILDLPPLGCINIHASLLPALRGAAPIQWSIINGDKYTGITSMYMDVGMDTGDMLLQEKTAILPRETSGQLFDRLADLGGEVLLKTLAGLAEGTVSRAPQDHNKATYAPMITKELGNLDFTKAPKEVCNLIYGLNPNPKAFTTFEGERLTVLEAIPVEGYSGQHGEILDTTKLIVGCGDGAVQLLVVQPQGKKAMAGTAFANGRHLIGGETLTFA